jgi:hypothetical protein
MCALLVKDMDDDSSVKRVAIQAKIVTKDEQLYFSSILRQVFVRDEVREILPEQCTQVAPRIRQTFELGE